MQYYELSLKKLHFIVTPRELRDILDGLHHVVANTGVKKDYTESDPEVFFATYEALYEKLKNGEELVWEKHHNLVMFSTGITAHPENCIYKPSTRLRVPHFAEPCPYLDTFCIVPYKEQLSTSFTVTQFPQYVCGLCLSFPARVEYETATDKHPAGIIPQTELDDFETYELLLSKIKTITKPLKLRYNDHPRRTSVRISPQAKEDIVNFHFVTDLQISVE